MDPRPVGNIRATLKKDHTQATKMRKFFNAPVLGTKPRIPTINMAMVHTMAEMTTTRRRPNLSVRRISETDVTRAMIAISCQSTLPTQTGRQLTQDGCNEKGVSESALLEEQTGICVEKRQSGKLLRTHRQCRPERAQCVGPFETLGIRAHQLLEALVL
jgi:hypothetical protein